MRITSRRSALMPLQLQVSPRVQGIGEGLVVNGDREPSVLGIYDDGRFHV